MDTEQDCAEYRRSQQDYEEYRRSGLKARVFAYIQEGLAIRKQIYHEFMAGVPVELNNCKLCGASLSDTGEQDTMVSAFDFFNKQVTNDDEYDDVMRLGCLGDDYSCLESVGILSEDADWLRWVTAVRHPMLEMSYQFDRMYATSFPEQYAKSQSE
jgi:hypothetical protein